MAKKKEKSGEFEFTGEMSAAAVTGLEFRDSFSPSESLDGMLERMEERIQKSAENQKEQHLCQSFQKFGKLIFHGG